jgi:hypothetical protein
MVSMQHAIVACHTTYKVTIVFFLLSYSPAPEFYVPMFRNTLSFPSSQVVCWHNLWRLNRQSVPKRWHIKFRITQKKAYNIPFISSLSFINLQFSFSFGSISLLYVCSSLTLCHIMWRSSLSLLPTACYSPSSPVRLLFSVLPKPVLLLFWFCLLLLFIICIHFVAVQSFCVIFCIIPY